MLNYHATFTKGTVEFRLFQFDAPADGKLNGLHAGQLKSYIQLCLALSQMAKEVRTASPNSRRQGTSSQRDLQETPHSEAEGLLEENSLLPPWSIDRHVRS